MAAAIAIVVLVAAASAGCGDDSGIERADTGSETVEDTGSETTADTQPSDADATEDQAFDGFEVGPGSSGRLEPTGSRVAAEGAAQLDLDGASVAVEAGVLDVGRDVTIAGAEDIVPAGFIPVGPPVAFTSEAPFLPGWAHFSLPFRRSLMPPRTGARHLHLFTRRPVSGRVYTAAFPDLQEDLDAGRVTFRALHLGVYQLAVKENAGQPYQRRLTYRAITGVSMGAGAALMIAMRHPDEFDGVGALGGAADWIYLQHYLGDHGLGGFCKAPQTGLCPGVEATEEFEISMTYNAWHSPSGDGNGGTFDRTEYVRIFRDLAYAFGNTASYNPDSPYRPAGVPREELLRPEALRCAENPTDTFTIASGYYDDEYNPDGSLPVIMFCDGEDGNPKGYFDDTRAHTEATEVTLAVDVDGDGRRDADEPVIRNLHEPYQDLGSDGLASVDESGYDALANPDPADDDYHWLTNPTGTEGNWLHDPGEPYDDFGLDGVDGTATSPYDHGEGNGAFDYNPNLLSLFERSPRWNVAKLSEAALDRLTLYVDGGIRDLFNFDVAGTHFTGALSHAGGNVRMYDTFAQLAEIEPGDSYDITRVDFANLGDHVFMRYGDPNASLPLIEDGDGKHVGSNTQAVQRFLTMFGYLTDLWVNGDYTQVLPPYSSDSEVSSFVSPALNDAIVTFAINLPPNYDQPEFADTRYPVIYLLHGYGQGPEDLPATGLILASYQANGLWPKAIIVYPQGFCGDNAVTQCSDGVDNDNDGFVDTADTDCASAAGSSEAAGALPFCGDGVDNDGDGFVDAADPGCKDGSDVSEAECVKGNFFTNHVAWPDGEPPGPQFEDAIFDLIRHVETHYRVRAPEEVTFYH